MYSYRTLILFPQIDDYSSIHEWSLIATLKDYSECTLQAYLLNDNLGNMMHHFTNDGNTRIVIIFGAEEQWHFLHNAFSHHPNCIIQSNPSPYHFYARMNNNIHILGLTPNADILALTANQLTNQYRALAPQTLSNLSAQIGKTLKHAGLTISCAESCTGGFIAKTLTDIAGASAYFHGGACTYTADVKQRVLHIAESTLTANGVVSQETAQAMAIGAQKLFASNIALSTTGVAGPGPDSDGNPEGLVYCCIAINNDTYVYQFLATDETLCTDRTFIRSACVRFLFEKLLILLHH